MRSFSFSFDTAFFLLYSLFAAQIFVLFPVAPLGSLLVPGPHGHRAHSTSLFLHKTDFKFPFSAIPAPSLSFALFPHRLDYTLCRLEADSNCGEVFPGYTSFTFLPTPSCSPPDDDELDEEAEEVRKAAVE